MGVAALEDLVDGRVLGDAAVDVGAVVQDDELVEPGDGLAQVAPCVAVPPAHQLGVDVVPGLVVDAVADPGRC